MVVKIPFGLDDEREFREQFLSFQIVDALQLGERVVYVGLAKGKVAVTDVTKDTPVPRHVIVDSFSLDFVDHIRHVWTETVSWEHSLWPSKSNIECVVDCESGRILLNTYRLHAPWDNVSGDWRSRDPGRAGQLFEIDEAGIRHLSTAPDPLQLVFAHQHEYRFGDLIVRMASEFKMECVTTSGELRWVLNLKSYLYTKVQERHGILYFGTAGNGGYCWGVSLRDGTVQFAVKTGGTVRYAWWGERLVCSGRKGELIVLDSADGSEFASIPLGNLKIQDDSPLLIVGQSSYTTACDKNTNYAVMVPLSAPVSVA